MFEGLVASIKDERRKAVAEAWAEADEKAWREKLESARKFKAKGYPADDIAEILFLPKDVVTGL
jgi:hypothetical protein